MAAKAKKLAGKKAKKENKGMMKVELHRNVILGLKEKMFTTLMDVRQSVIARMNNWMK